MTTKPKIKWTAPVAAYSITRYEQTDCRVNVRHSVTGQCMTEADGSLMTVDGTCITAYAGDVAVLVVRIAGSHSQTLANYRETMARKIQDAGGSWLGRSHATEDARADARQARMYDPAVTPNVEDRVALRDSYYGRMPLPSSY